MKRLTFSDRLPVVTTMGWVQLAPGFPPGDGDLLDVPGLDLGVEARVGELPLLGPAQVVHVDRDQDQHRHHEPEGQGLEGPRGHEAGLFPTTLVVHGGAPSVPGRLFPVSASVMGVPGELGEHGHHSFQRVLSIAGNSRGGQQNSSKQSFRLEIKPLETFRSEGGHGANAAVPPPRGSAHRPPDPHCRTKWAPTPANDGVPFD